MNLDWVNNVFSEKSIIINELVQIIINQIINYHKEGEMQQDLHTNVCSQVPTLIDMQQE